MLSWRAALSISGSIAGTIWFSPGPRCGPRSGVLVSTGIAAPAHRRRLIDERQRVAGRAEIAAADVGPVLLHDVEIGGEQPAILAEAELELALEGRARGADGVFLDAA